MRMILPLTPSEGKCLIAKAILQMPLFQKSMESGRVVISNGTTTGYIIRELNSEACDIAKYPSGICSAGRLCETPRTRVRTHLYEKGELVARDLEKDDYEEMAAFFKLCGKGDLYIKGANAIDREGNAGFFLAHPNGGQLLMMLPRITAGGVKLLVPVGLEKLIVSVPDAAKRMCGNTEWDIRYGMGVGYLAVTNATIVTEIEAIRILSGAEAVPVGAGGIGGGEGSVVIAVEGKREQIRMLQKLLKGIKGEPPIRSWKKACESCLTPCAFPE